MLQLPRPTVLFWKLLLFTTPIFLLFSTLALYFVYSERFFDARADFSTRLGNTVARTSGAIENVPGNHSDDVSAKKDATHQLLQLMLGDQAIKCAILSSASAQTPDLYAPSKVACRFADVDDWLEVQLKTAEWAKLRVGFSTEQVSQIRQSQIRNSITVLALSLLASITSSWFAFRAIVGRPLNALIQDLVHAREAAEDANAAKTRFLANMSHELRTPLNGILGNADFLKDTTLSKSQLQCLSAITKSGNALTSIINNVLEFAHIDATPIKLQHIEFDLIELIYETVAIIELDAAEKGIDLSVYCPIDLEYKFLGDAARFRQILLNLLSNAIKFTSQGTITLKVSHAPKDGCSEIFCVIADTGVGISSDKLEVIFEPFIQVDDSTTRQFGGTGLGLAISRELAIEMGGELTAKSTFGKGSEFTCRVSLQHGSAAKMAEEYTALKSLADNQPAKVLLADDCDLSTAQNSELLSLCGINCDTTSLHHEILSKLEAGVASGEPYTAVLLSSKMALLGTKPLVKKIRSNPSIKDIVVILMAPITSIMQPLCVSCDDYASIVSKPLKPKTLANSLYEVLHNRAEAKHGSDSTVLLQTKDIFQGLKFLLVDDHEVNLTVLSGQLQSTGAILRLASDGLQALEAFSDYNPEVVLMDIAMPNMDGFEATKQIRKAEAERGTRSCLIFAVSGNVLTEFKDNAKAAGMDGFIEKPTDRESLISAIVQKLGAIAEHSTVKSFLKDENTNEVVHIQSETEKDNVIDMGRLGALQSMFTNAEFSNLLETFIENADDIIAGIEGHIEEGNSLEASRSAHRLKGSSSNLGCFELSQTMAELEQALKAGLEVSPESFESIRGLWSATRAALIQIKPRE